VSGSVVFWLAAALLLFWSLGAYNRLVRLRAQVISRFSAVDQRLAQALAVLDEAVAATPHDGAAGTGAAAAGEHSAAASTLRSGLQAAAVQFEVALRVARKQPLDADAMAALQTAWATVHAVWELRRADSPERDATATALLQRAWEDCGHVVREAQADYNAAVRDYNRAITQFPAVVLAYFYGFKPAGAL
jgi:LemA protein